VHSGKKTTPNYLLFIAHTSEQVKRQCIYAIYSLIKTNAWMLHDERMRFLIYTEDQTFFADYFKHLHDWKDKIQFEILPQATFVDFQMVPKGKNLHRAKLKVFQHFFSKYQDSNLLYCDSDVYATEMIDQLVATVEQGHYVFHQNEGEILRPPNYGLKQVKAALEVSSLSHVFKLAPGICMYNAGIFWCCWKNRSVVDEALRVCDDIFDVNQLYFAEQFAISFAAQKSGRCVVAEREFIHYWYMKEFNEFIVSFLNRLKVSSSPDELLKSYQQLPLRAVPNFYRFKSIPYKIYRKWRSFLLGIGVTSKLYSFSNGRK
jgi:hypothetical protein